MGMRTNKKGFTLIELIVVVIIVGILASVATPIMMSIKKKAIVSEAIMALGTIRTAMRLFSLEHSYMPSLDNLEAAGLLKSSDIDGTYFTSGCYSFMASGPPLHMYVICRPASPSNNAPRKDDVIGWGESAYIAMDDAGTIYSNMSDLGYPSLGDI